MLAISLKKTAVPYPLLCFAAFYVLLYIFVIPKFLNWDINLWIGLLLAPFIANANPNKFSLRYLTPTLIAIVLTFCIPVKTLFFITTIFAMLLLIENTLGKTSEALLFLIFLGSPVFRYLISPVDFPIRLWLTEKTTDLLQTLGIKANAAGNIIEMEKYSFTVDPACAGLNMLVVSLMIGLFLFIHFQKQSGKKLNFGYLLSLLSLTVGLNILSNFFRILLIVIFKIMPDPFLHDLTGMICLVTYVIVPLLVIVKFMCKYFGQPQSTITSGLNFTTLRFPYLHGIIFVILLILAPKLVNADTFSPSNQKVTIKEFRRETLPSGILKFENKDALLYIKPALFFVPGHDPKLCWTGSGYTFEQIRKEKMAGVDVFTALLTKGKDRIYAAWWFDDGQTKTIDQLQWRWKSATASRQFYLVNVNATNRNLLTENASRLLLDKNYLPSRR